jgi:hypothetical protein
MPTFDERAEFFDKGLCASHADAEKKAETDRESHPLRFQPRRI